MTGRFTAALAGAPFGIKGFVRVKSLSGETEHLAGLKSVVLRNGDAEKSLDVEAVTRTGNGLAMKFRGIDSPEAAAALRGWELVVDRDHAAPLARGEYYVEDLKGLEVRDSATGAVLGRVSGVVDTGAASLLEVELPSAERKLVPFRKEFFRGIDTARKKADLLQPWILE